MQIYFLYILLFLRLFFQNLLMWTIFLLIWSIMRNIIAIILIFLIGQFIFCEHIFLFLCSQYCFIWTFLYICIVFLNRTFNIKYDFKYRKNFRCIIIVLKREKNWKNVFYKLQISVYVHIFACDCMWLQSKKWKKSTKAK